MVWKEEVIVGKDEKEWEGGKRVCLVVCVLSKGGEEGRD